jgi:hypothetical protein
MSTYITVTSDTGALVNRVKQVQQASREAQLQRERDIAAALKPAREVTLREPSNIPVGGNPDARIVRRPAAQREATGIFAAELTTRYDEPTNTFYVAASVPGVEGVVEVATAASGRGSVTPDPSYTDPTLFTAYGRVSKDRSTLQWSIYRNGSFGGGTNFDDRFAEPPRTSNQTDFNYPVSQRVGDQSASFLLPLSGKDGILIYIHNRIEIYNKYTRSTNRVFSSVNERNIGLDPVTLNPYAWGDPGYFADWDAEGHVRIIYILSGQESFSAYEVIAFYVSDKGVRRVDVPVGLETKLSGLIPPVSINGTGSYLSEINWDDYYRQSNTFVDIITTNYVQTYQDEPAFDQQVWQAASRYGALQSASFILPQHFGLGYLNTSSHKGSFFTPAIFRFITGPMSLTNTTAQSYAAMRAAYFSNAPFTFYAPCARTGSCQDATITEFDLTRTQPATVTTALPANQFRRNKRTDVVIGAPKGEILYAWDWGKPADCRRKVLDLGFTAQDLTP